MRDFRNRISHFFMSKIHEEDFKMKAETEKKIEQLYDQGNLGYAYIFPKGSEGWDERLTFHLSPENIANVLMGNAYKQAPKRDADTHRRKCKTRCCQRRI